MTGTDLVRADKGGIAFTTQKFAFGQRIGLRTDTTSTQAIMTALDSLTKVPGDLTSILGALFGPTAPTATWGYDPAVQWLVGVEINYSIVSFDVLLIDGEFYGMRIKIGPKPKPPPNGKNGKKNGDNGENGENGNGNGENGNGENGNGNGNGNGPKPDDDPFGGLELEILYRKVADHLGEYSADLTLPKKYRTIKLEAASLTLPSVGLAIWTNGDFKVSIGWPLGDRSLSIIFPPDPIPWAGGGGLYFAKLRSEDAPGLGTDFGTIIEFGIALRIGAATQGDWGIVKYSASIYLFGTFQGMLAWREGKTINEGVDYYWFAATVGLQGSLSAEVDFKIITISLSLTLMASAGLALETEHKSTAEFEFKVTVEASVKILFFRIKLSYTLDLKKDITFGSGATAALLTGPTPPTQVVPARPALAEFAARPALAAAPSAIPIPPVTVNAQLVLQPTIRYDTASSTWKSAAVASLIVERPDTGSGGGDQFSPLVGSLVTYLATTYGGYTDPTQPLQPEQLDAVGKALDAGTFDLPAIYAWLATVQFTIAGATSGTGPEVPAAVLPMIPGLALTYGGTTTTFGDATEPPEYAQVLTDYFAQLSMVGDGSIAEAALATAPAPAVTWFPGVIFHDYFNMLGKQAAQELHEAAVKTPVPLAQALAGLDVANLAGVVTRFLQHGLRVPDPASASGPLDQMPTRGLYELTGQQFDLVDDGTGNKILTATIAAASPSVAVTVTAGEAALLFALSNPPEASPLLSPQPLPPIQFVPSFAMLRQGYSWADESTTWALYDFPEMLQADLRLRSPLLLDLATIDENNQTAPIDGVEGLMIRFSLAPVPQAPGEPPPSMPVFQVAGTDDATRDLIELLFASGDLAKSQLDLLLPGATAGTYATTAANAAATLLKTDLSSAGQPALSALFADALRAGSPAPALGPTAATIADATDFLRLLWECSVVHSGGFFLALPDASALKGAASYEVALLVRPTTAAASTVTVDAYHTTILTTPTTDRVQAGIRDAADGTPLTQPLPSYPAGTLAFGASWTKASNPPVPSDAEASDSGAYAAALYQLLQFAIVPDDFVDGSGWSQPLGPNGTADAWSYQRAAPVQRFVKNAPATPNRYIAIGHTTKLDLQLVDVYGNAQALAPLNVTPVYNDPLIPIDEWPGTTAQFAFAAAAAGSATLTIDVAFDPAQVQHKDVALLQYQTVADQLTDPRTSLTVTSALAARPVKTDQDARAALAGLVAQITAYLAPESPGPAPAPVTLTATLPTAYAGQIGVDMFPVWVSIETVRDAPGNGKYPDGFLSVTAQVVPRLGADTDKDAALAAWAGDFESAFAGFDGKGALLKVLSGSPPSKVKATASALGATAAGDVTSVPGDLWALRWSPTVGVAVEFGNAGAKPADAAPVYFTPMPLATQLAGGVVDIVAYDSSGNPLANPVSTTYSGVDLDMWARAFLSAVDALLAPDLASAIARLDSTSYAALMTAKEDIAYAISASVSWVFADQMPPAGGGPGAGDLTRAQTVFRESLLTSLATDFATSAIVQVPATVSVNGPFEQGADGRAPELFGSPTPPGKSMTGQYTFTSATLPAVAGTGSLTFLAEVVHPTQQADLCLPFAYDVGFVDHRFQTSEEQFGYVPSSWLRFVLPNSDPGAPPDPVLNVPMGQLDIPVPLRAYPSPPRLVSQAITGASAPATLAAAVMGTYSLAVGTPSVAQDDLHLAVLFNGAPVPTGDTAVGGGNPLFAPLASFQDFQANYLDTARTAIATGAPTAKQWLADVLAQVQQVATAWQGGDAEEALFADAGDGTPPPPAPFTWGFVLWVPDEAKNVVMLRWTDATQTPPGGAWPQIDGTSGTVVDTLTRSFTLSSLPPELTLTWPGLSVVTHQQISTAAWIVRNEELGGGCAGAVEHGETNPGLVYRTPVVTFQDPVVPLLEVPGTITVASSSLTDATGQLVSGLMTPTSPAAQVGWGVDAAYSFTLVNGAPGTLDTRLPIFLARASVSTVTPPPPVNVDTIASLSAKLKGELATWYGSFTPGAVNARLLFSLTLFAAGTEQPILRLTDVEAPIAGAAWWQS